MSDEFTPTLMRIELVVARESEACRKAEALWRSVCESHGETLSVLMEDSPWGSRAIERLGLTALPALLIDGKPVAVGVPSRAQAYDLISDLRAKLR